MITVLIGSAGSGKTTWVLQHYTPVRVVEDEVPITETEEGAVLIGDYTRDRRELGTDTISYSAIEKIISVIKRFDKSNIDVVVEGDRINNGRFMHFLETRKDRVQLYLVLTDINTAYQRLRQAGSTISYKFLKTTYTKSLNNYRKYKGVFKSGVIYT